jgi:hypothetical protein
MPHRRLAGLTLSMLAAAAVAACSIEIDPSSAPAPFVQAPVPSASTGRPAYVCTAVYQILTSGAARLAGAHKSAGATRDTLTDMATRIKAEGALSDDANLKQAIDDIATDLTTASQQPDPRDYVNGGFTTVGQKLDGHCD